MDPEVGSLLVLGNLLLDMISPVEEAYLEQYDLQPDSIQVADMGKHSGIYEEILENPDVTLSPGGSALNSTRMAQRILNLPGVITLIGAVGLDDTGRLLIDRVRDEGIQMCLQTVEGSATGKCASLLTSGGYARTMVTDLGAALKFSHGSFLEDENALESLDKAKCVYISGYFLKVSPETVMEVARRAKSKNVPILVNLNAVWITRSCKQELLNLLPYTDVLFGNESEVVSFGNQIGLPNTNQNIFEIVKHLSSMKIMVIVTRGERPIILASNGAITEYCVQTVAKSDIVDSTGAGDAFVGGREPNNLKHYDNVIPNLEKGFLAYYIQGKDIGECVDCGIWTATEELKGRGFILPSAEAILDMPDFLQQHKNQI